MRTALLWDITQRVVVIPCRRFGTTYLSNLQDSWHLKMEPVECPETLARNYQHSLRSSVEDRDSRVPRYFPRVRSTEVWCCLHLHLALSIRIRSVLPPLPLLFPYTFVVWTGTNLHFLKVFLLCSFLQFLLCACMNSVYLTASERHWICTASPVFSLIAKNVKWSCNQDVLAWFQASVAV